MFYESERIIHKNRKYVKSMAYDILGKIKEKYSKHTERVAIIDVMIASPNTNETQKDILQLARKIVISEQEKKDE